MHLTPIFRVNTICIVLALLLFSSISFGQTKGSVNGSILDSASRTPIERATVAVVNAKDTSLISYTITQKGGTFKLSGLPAGVDIRLIISTMRYTTFRQTLVLKPGENRNIAPVYLTPRSLAEVVVKGERSPIVMKKDTIEFNTEAFKTRPNAVVEDLLRLLPGVQINVDGTIMVNGKNVSKLLIDGKRFFGDNITVGTKNLDADLVDKIQMYDDRDEDPDHKLTDLEVNTIINLKMKSKIKKSTLGKVYAGGGTRGRYEGGGIISTFRDTLQVSVIGTTNNLTRTGFSSSELYSMGGFNRSGGSAQNDGTFGGNGDGGIEKMWSGGFNINNDYGKKLKTNVMYFYYNYVKDYDKKLLNEQTLDQTLLSTASRTISQIRQQRHSVSSLIEWVPDTLQRIRLDLRVDVSPTGFDANSLTNTFNTQTPKLSDLVNTTSNKGLANEFTDNFLYYRRLKKPGASLTVNQSSSFKKSSLDTYNLNDLTSYTPAFPSSTLDRYTNNGSTYYAGAVSATYNNPFSKKVSNEVYAQSRYYYTSNKLATYDKAPTGDYDIFLGDQSSNLNRPHFIQNLKNTLSYNFNPKLTLKAALDLEIQSYTNNFNSAIPNTTNRYTYLFPSLRLNGEHFNINYSEGANPPDISQMQPITTQISPVETLTGNPNLTPGRQRNLYYGYYNYNNDKQSYINVNGGLKIFSNNIAQVSTRDENGFITSTYANKNSGWTANFSAVRGKQFKKSQKWQISLNGGAFGSYDQRPFFFNGDEGVQHNYYLNAGQNVGINYRSIVNWNSTYILTDQITNYSQVSYSSVHTLQHKVTSIASVSWPKSFIFDAQYQFSYNPQIAPGFSRSQNVLNLAVTMMMFKQNRGQVKLSVYDLFDQNTNVYRYASNNSVTSGEQQILKRYFLINYQYKFNTFKKK